MKTKMTVFILGGLVAGSLMFSAGPVLAWNGDGPRNLRRDFHRRDFGRPAFGDRWRNHSTDRYFYRRWRVPPARVPVIVDPPPPIRGYGYPAYEYPVTQPTYRQDLYRRLQNARRIRAYHLAKHASRETLLYDNLRIARLERELGLRR